jgi:hypothetical protein
MKYNFENFVSDLTEIILLCEIELDKWENGIEGQGSIEQLKMIIFEFQELLDYAKKGRIYEKYPKRALSAAYFVVDSWDYNAEVSLKIMRLQENFRKLKK